MPSLDNTIIQPPKAKQISSVLEALCEQQYYVTDQESFFVEKDSAKALIYWLTEFTPIQQIKTTEDVVTMVHRVISEIDHMINTQLNCIIHHPKLQKLEASWRGLTLLTTVAEDVRNIKIKLLDIKWSEVEKDLSRASDFDQSQLFQKIYNEEYGIAGGEPYGVLIGDYEISHRNSERHPHNDLATLEAMSLIAAAAFAPFIAGASSDIFELEDFSGLAQPLNLEATFSSAWYTKWHSLRDKPDTRFIGLTVPRMIMRVPYRTKPGSFKGMFFYEQCGSDGNEHYLWGNACFGFAMILLREFKNVGWFGHIRGVLRDQISGGLLTNTPVEFLGTDAAKLIHKPMTDVIITDARERELSDLGFIPLCQAYDTPYAAFYNNQSIQKPKYHSNKEVNTNAKLSVMLQHILCGSRIAHYIKVIFRDKIGSLLTASMVENHIQDWLHRYTSGRDDLEWEQQAEFPLKKASVRVKEHPAKPGQYVCVIHLQPHYQLDQMVSELELATELLQPGK